MVYGRAAWREVLARGGLEVRAARKTTTTATMKAMTAVGTAGTALAEQLEPLFLGDGGLINLRETVYRPG